MNKTQLVGLQKDFSEYVGSYYAIDSEDGKGNWADLFNNELVQDVVDSFVPDFAKWAGPHFDDDTECREVLCDIMLVSLGYQTLDGVMFDDAVESFLKWRELNQN